MMDWLLHPDQYKIREAGVDDVATLFVVQTAIDPIDAGQLTAWTDELETRLEAGGRLWVITQGHHAFGFASVDPVPGLPGLYDLAGGIAPVRRRQGLGTRLLRHLLAAAAGADISRFSCRVDDLTEETAVFLLRRGFQVDHEECQLELPLAHELPPIPDDPPGELRTFPRSRAPVEFCRLYEACFSGHPWAQPYTEAEVAGLLVEPEDLLFMVVGGRPIGVVWQERLPGGRGRIEPVGIAPTHQGRGYGRRLMLAALHRLRERGANLVEIGLWRDNLIALRLYESLGFQETAHWFYLAIDLRSPTGTD